MDTIRGEHGNNSASFQFFMEQNFNKDIKILEIGCNLGTLTHMLYNAGYTNISGIDITKEGISLGKQKYPNISNNIHLYSGKQIPFGDSEFDVVVSFDVLEHIPEVDYHLQEVYRVLKKGGVYLGQTPNKITNIPWEIINQKSFTKWKSYHCSLQTLNSLYTIFNKNGFQSGTVKKRDLLNEFNIQKVQDKLGKVGLVLLKMVNNFPICLQTNFWFQFKK